MQPLTLLSLEYRRKPPTFSGTQLQLQLHRPLTQMVESVMIGCLIYEMIAAAKSVT